MPDVINRRELRIIGLSRSGNHAIIQWIVAQAAAMQSDLAPDEPARVLWLNCCEGKYNPYWTARPFDSGDPYWVSYSPFHLDREKARVFSRKDWFLFNHEDNWLRVAASAELEREHDAWVGPSAERRDLLILRDPFNLFASRWRNLEPVVSDGIALRMWKQQAREALGRSSFLKHDPLIVLYNRWCDDTAYRRRIAESLGLAFTDANRERVAAVHGGSSFDGFAYDGKAAAMPVQDRWRRFADDPSFVSLFDQETFELAEALFGETPAARALRARATPRRTTSLRGGAKRDRRVATVA